MSRSRWNTQTCQALEVGHGAVATNHQVLGTEDPQVLRSSVAGQEAAEDLSCPHRMLWRDQPNDPRRGFAGRAARIAMSGPVRACKPRRPSGQDLKISQKGTHHLFGDIYLLDGRRQGTIRDKSHWSSCDPLPSTTKAKKNTKKTTREQLPTHEDMKSQSDAPLKRFKLQTFPLPTNPDAACFISLQRDFILFPSTSTNSGHQLQIEKVTSGQTSWFLQSFKKQRIKSSRLPGCALSIPEKSTRFVQ